VLRELPILQLKREPNKKGGGSYLSQDKRIYVLRNEDKLWAWGYHDYNDKGEFIGSRNGDDSLYGSKTHCVEAINKVLYEQAYDEALWEN
jgi:hypothetical protein